MYPKGLSYIYNIYIYYIYYQTDMAADHWKCTTDAQVRGPARTILFSPCPRQEVWPQVKTQMPSRHRQWLRPTPTSPSGSWALSPGCVEDLDGSMSGLFGTCANGQQFDIPQT